jgi:hypothetical protein
MATQTRIVLNPSVQNIAEEIKETTNASSLSEVVTLLLSRYGPHLVAWWKTNPHQTGLATVAVSSNDFAIPRPDVDLSTPIEL